MSKKRWRKGVCECGSCKKCKDRARLGKKRSGTWSARVPDEKTKRKEEKVTKLRMSWKRVVRKLLEREHQIRREAEKPWRIAASKWRTTRNRILSAVYLNNNPEIRGKRTAMIANIIEKKRNGLFRPSDTSEARYKAWKETQDLNRTNDYTI